MGTRGSQSASSDVLNIYYKVDYEHVVVNGTSKIKLLGGNEEDLDRNKLAVCSGLSNICLSIGE